MDNDELLSIAGHTEDDEGFISLSGQLLAKSRHDLERMLREWNRQGIIRIVISCRDLLSIDSAGLSTMLGAVHRMRKASGDLILAEMNPSLKALFEIAAMRNYFKIFANPEDAKEHFKELRLIRNRETVEARKKKEAAERAAAKKKPASAKKKAATKKKNSPTKKKRPASKKKASKKKAVKKKSPTKKKSAPKKKSAGKKKGQAKKKTPIKKKKLAAKKKSPAKKKTPKKKGVKKKGTAKKKTAVKSRKKNK